MIDNLRAGMTVYTLLFNKEHDMYAVLGGRLVAKSGKSVRILLNLDAGDLKFFSEEITQFRDPEVEPSIIVPMEEVYETEQEVRDLVNAVRLWDVKSKHVQ